MLTEQELLQKLDDMATAARSYYRLAAQLDFTRQELSAVKSGKRPFPKRLLEKMGYRAETIYLPS